MNKKEIQKRVLQNGKPISLDKFEWNEETKTFSSAKNGLVLDFTGIDGCTFDTGSYCTFKTGSYCTFDTGWDCTFKTGENCVVVRRDIYEVIELKENTKIKLNDYKVKGFMVLEDEDKESDEVEILIEGVKKIISRKSAKALNLI